MHSLLPVCWIALSQALVCPAASPVQQIQDQVVAGYKAVDEFSVVYVAVVNDVNLGTGKHAIGTEMSSIAYRYNRAQRKLAIGLDGVPVLLVDGNRAFIWLWENEGETGTYLELEKSHAIGWSDIDEVMQLIKKQYPLAGIPCYLPGPVLPLLEGGVERLFPKKTRVVKRDDRNDAFFVAGHPENAVLIGTPDKSKLDPKKYPRCIKTENAVSTWHYAIHHETGLISGAMGDVRRMPVMGTPGNNIRVFLKHIVTYPAGEEYHEFPEVPLRLPRTAKIISMDQLKSRLYKEVMRGGLDELIDQHKAVYEELQAIIETEQKLTQKIVEQQANPARKPKELKQLQLELESTQGTRKTYAYVEAAARNLIEEVRQKQKQLNGN
ncbi:MAG: hypothetical protein IID44_23115 [Planctomycetes bacterium]|nr:hypothetical protein [Planctomycetota bacterium]